TSEPSRSTATPTTTPRAASGRRPSRTAAPRARASLAMARPWFAIQMLCQASIRTAAMSTVAWNTSWPEPANAWPSSPANAATRPERVRPHRALAVAGNYFFHLQRGGIELLRRGVQVAQPEHDPLPGGNLDLGRLEAVIPDDQLARHRVVGQSGGQGERYRRES